MADEQKPRGEEQTVKVESPETPDLKTAKASVAPMAPAPEPPVAAEPRPRKIAVLSIHGMGEQIPFETIDQVQGNFCAAASRAGHPLSQPSVQMVNVGDEVLRRAEIRMGKDPGDPEIHFYEAYWAPLTEGRIGLRDVIGFLAMGGSNGLQNSIKGSSWRYMFHQRFPFPRSIADSLYLGLALAAVSSLVILNTIVLAVAAATNWLPTSNWLSPEKALQDDLTGVASLVCLVGAALAAGLSLGITRRGLSQGKPWRMPAIHRFCLDLLFYLTLILLVACAVTMVWLVKQHAALTEVHQSFSILNLILGGDAQAARLATVVTGAILLIALIALVGMLFRLPFLKPLAPVGRLVANAGIFLVLAAFAAAGIYLVALLRGIRVPSISTQELWPPVAWIFESRRLWIWSSLIGLSVFARRFLVQYLGDVAIYVSSHRLDRFNEIRDRIRAEVFKTARAVYADRTADGAPRYDQIALVGHSLGSVIAYDTLNYLINQDLLSQDSLGAATRTGLLLTFGSPLDKIAYLFQTQGTRTSDTREALANAGQPLIQSYAYRQFKWINVYSDDDIIGGSLELYDDESGNPRSVDNRQDPYASIPLVAHTEYWQSPVAWDHLYREVRDLAG